MADPAQGILHILAASHHSRWQLWVMNRLRRQAQLIVEKELNVFVLSWVPWSAIGNFRSIPKLFKSLLRGFVGG